MDTVDCENDMKIENQSSSKKLTTKYQLVILFTGIALPLILVFLTRTDSVVFSDAVDYLAVAESLNLPETVFPWRTARFLFLERRYTRFSSA